MRRVSKRIEFWFHMSITVEAEHLAQLNNATLGIVQRGDDCVCVRQQRIERRSIA